MAHLGSNLNGPSAGPTCKGVDSESAKSDIRKESIVQNQTHQEQFLTLHLKKSSKGKGKLETYFSGQSQKYLLRNIHRMDSRQLAKNVLNQN